MKPGFHFTQVYSDGTRTTVYLPDCDANFPLVAEKMAAFATACGFHADTVGKYICPEGVTP